MDDWMDISLRFFKKAVFYFASRSYYLLFCFNFTLQLPSIQPNKRETQLNSTQQRFNGQSKWIYAHNLSVQT